MEIRGTMGWTLVASLVLVAPTAVGADPNPYAHLGGPTQYFVALGNATSARMSFGEHYDGHDLMPFEACGWVQVRPELETGKVEVHGIINRTVPFSLEMDTFQGSLGTQQGGIAENITDDGHLDAGDTTHPRVFERLAGWGSSSIAVFDHNLTDPYSGKGDADFGSSVTYTPNGYRDDATGAIRTKRGTVYDPGVSVDPVLTPGKGELHVRFFSPTSDDQQPTTVFRSAGDQDDLIVQQSEHIAAFTLPNLAFGGQLDLRLHAETRSALPATPTRLRVTVEAPDGSEAGNATLTPGLNQPADDHLRVPSDQFGDYRVTVNGPASLANYSIAAKFVPPPQFVFELWWDNVTLGAPANGMYASCQKQVNVDGLAPVVGIPTRPPGPRLNLELVAAGIAVCLVGTLLLVKVAADQHAARTFKSIFRRK